MYPTLIRIAGPMKARHCRQNPDPWGGTATVPCIPSSEVVPAGTASGVSLGLVSTV
jgi:hypothetical protein